MTEERVLFWIMIAVFILVITCLIVKSISDYRFDKKWLEQLIKTQDDILDDLRNRKEFKNVEIKTEDGRVYKTTDSGLSWTLVSKELKEKNE